MTTSVRLTIAALAAIATAPTGAGAARVTTLAPVRQLPLRAGVIAPYHATRIGPHTFYGTIVAMNGTRLVIRLRSGRSQAIDGTRAVAANDYSSPLFVGKIVAVDGTFKSGVFSAQHIYRLSNLLGLQNDR